MEILKNLFHVSLQTGDYEAALGFYRDTLGFEQLFELNVGQFKKMLHMGAPDGYDGEPWLTYLRVAPDQYIELFNGVVNPPDFVRRPAVYHRDSPLNWFALGSADPEETAARLCALGLPLENGFFTGPDGVRIRLVPSGPGAPPPAAPRLFNSLAGVSLRVGDLAGMTAHLERMCLKTAARTGKSARLMIGEQFVELEKYDAAHTCGDDVLSHLAIGVYDIAETARVWGANGVRCVLHPYPESEVIPMDGSAKGGVGMDLCEIIWTICPEGNKIEVMAEHGHSLQQDWERAHPF